MSLLTVPAYGATIGLRRPRLDRAALRRGRQDPARSAALIARRTALSPESIKQVLLMPAVSDEDVSTWFG